MCPYLCGRWVFQFSIFIFETSGKGTCNYRHVDRLELFALPLNVNPLVYELPRGGDIYIISYLYGEIGRRVRLKILSFGVLVQVQ